MELLVPILKYAFVIGLGVEVLLILRSLVMLAREKARAAVPTAPAEE